MLTPGQWVETKNPWHGFFNPSSFPSLFFRTGITLMMAGLFGILSTLFFAPKDKRQVLLKYNIKWLYVALPILVLSSIWYFSTVPEVSKVVNFEFNRQVLLAKKVLYLSSVLLYLLSLLLLARVGLILQRMLGFLLLFIGLLWIGGFEHLREYARRPYVIYDYLYSFGLKVEDETKVNEKGFLKYTRWASVKEITEENKLLAGKEIFNFQCLSCHTVKGLRNDIVKKAEGLTYFGIISQLYGQGKVLGYMPKFVGTEKEREALAAFIAEGLLGKAAQTPEPKPAIKELKEQPLAFNPEKDEYALFVFSPLGMKCVTDADRWFSFLPPGSTLEAVVIKRGLKPEVVNQGIKLVYRVEPGFETPSKHVLLWDYAQPLFNQTIAKNLGLTGKGLNGTFDWDDKRKVFIAKGLPVLPYKNDGTYNPYPIFVIELIDQSSGKVLQRTKVVSPVATEFRCYVCHDGGLRWNDIAGISDQTAINILKAHDKNHQTNFYQSALQGKPVFCQKCHPDFIVGSKGIKGHKNFSTSMHGWHANYMPYKDEKACYLCHPDHPQANTKCYRDIHKKLGLECIDCHGNIDFHATALLLGEKSSRTAKFLLANLNPNIPKEKIKPRKPWIQQPDCLTCHKGFKKPIKEAKAYNYWTEGVSDLFRVRKENTQKLPCLTCHGSPHTIYPAFNPYGISRDNLQPLQYQKNILPIGANFRCEVCHKKKMRTPLHHPNILRTFRNIQVLP